VALGRGLDASDFGVGRPAVALISHRLWQTRFGGDPSIIGRRFEASSSDRPDDVETFTVVGVLPARFWHLNVFTDVLVPLRAPTYPYMVRLREHVRADVAAERIGALVRSAGIPVPERWRVELRSTHAVYVEQVRPLLLSVAAATALVFLIGAANIAVLLLVRATQSRRDVAVRKALGASAGQIARVLAAEGLVLGAAATALGLTLAQGIITAMAPVMERQIGRGVPGGADTLALEPLTVFAGIAAGLLTSSVCMLAPLIAYRRTPTTLVLSGGQKGATDDRTQRRARSVLIAVEVAACLTLLIGAALMAASGIRMLRVDMGLRADDVLVGRINLRARSYPEAADRVAFYERTLDEAARRAAARGLAFTSSWPLQGPPPQDVRADEGAGQTTVRAGRVAVSPAYFETLSIAVRDGRPFVASDRLGADPVAVVSATLARRLWPDRRAVGQRLRVVPPATNTATPLPSSSYLVVGVVADIRSAHTDEDLSDFYVSLLQHPPSGAFVYSRGAGARAVVERELREILAAVDQEVPLGMSRPLTEILDLQRAGPSFLAMLLVMFSSLAALLALMGIYGVIAYAVRQREREIAVRIAIGADRRSIVQLFIRQGLIVLSVGLAMGIAGAFALGRVLQAQLLWLQAGDPVFIGATTIAFAICGLAAIAWPALTAASTDPATALKN
jgi:predicted permease